MPCEGIDPKNQNSVQNSGECRKFSVRRAQTRRSNKKTSKEWVTGASVMAIGIEAKGMVGA
jgi:hypothetical protein